jgi:hypothetical protein
MKNKKNNIKNAINANRKYDMDLLHAAGFSDVASALAALDSVRTECRQVEHDYDDLLMKYTETIERLISAEQIIVAQAHVIHKRNA